VEINADREILDGTECPADGRFTLQLIEIMEGHVRSAVVRAFYIGRDAAFAVDSGTSRPSALLLHYRYGAAALRWWGHHTDVLRTQRHTRPQSSDPGPSYLTGRPMSNHNRTTAIQKREHSNTAGGSKKKRGRAPKTAVCYKDSITVDVVDEPVDDWMEWDEDDWMAFFMYNTKAARERRQAAEEESSTNIKAWAQNVSDSQSTEL